MTGSYPKVYIPGRGWNNLIDTNLTLSSLGGIEVVSPQDDDILRYVSASSEFRNTSIQNYLSGKTIGVGTLNASSASVVNNLVVGSTLTVNGVLVSGGGGSGSVSTEQIQDAAAPLLDHALHTNITATYDDANNRILLSTPVNPTTEDIQDAAAPLLAHAFHTNVTATYDDISNRVLLTSTASAAVSTEQIQDAASPLFDHAFHTNLTATYDDANNRVLLAATLPSGASAQTNFYDVVRDYAVVAGEANSATKIQNALNAASASGGGTVYIAPGTYNIGATLQIFSGTTLLLTPKTVMFRTFSSSPMIANGAYGASYSAYAGQSNIRIIGGIWESRAQAYPTTPAMGMSIGHGTDIIIQDLTISNIGGYHAIEINSSKNVRIKNCRFTGYIDTGSRGYSEAIQIDLAKSAAVFGWFGAYDDTPCEDVIIDSCYFGASGTVGTTSWPTGIGTHSYTAGYYHTNVKMINNYFDAMTEFAIRTYVMYKNLIIANNIISGSYGGIAIGLDGAADHTTTSQPAPQQSQNITISNNIINNAGKNGAWGIALWNVDGAIVTNNHVQNITKSGTNIADGISFITVTDGLISNNRIEDVDSDGIDVRTTSSGIMISNNIIKDVSQKTNNTDRYIYISDSVSNTSIIANRGFKEGANVAVEGLRITSTCTVGMRAFGNHIGSAATTAYVDSTGVAVTTTTNA